MKVRVLEHGLEGRVYFPGIVQDPALAFSVMDLYVTLNIGKLTGLAAMEAAYSGLPVLGIQLLSDYSTQANDWIWSSKDSLELAEQAIGLIQSPDKLKMLAKRQREYVYKHHTSEVMANSYLDLYQKIKEDSLNKGY